MKLGRREFFWGVPAGVAGLSLLPKMALPQAISSPVVGNHAVDQSVVDYWVKSMGVASDDVPNIPVVAATRMGVTRGGVPANTAPAGNGDPMREPLFFYYHPDDNRLVLSQDLDLESLAKEKGDNKDRGPDAHVKLQMHRIRFGDEDSRNFGHYNSGGLYLDVQQSPAAASPDYGALAWSLFGALLPSGGGGGKPSSSSSSSGSSASKSSAKTGGGSSTASAPPAAVLAAAPAASSPQPALQQPAQAETISLPSGLGSSAFACYMKDRRHSAFGGFLASILQSAPASASLFMPLFNMPAIGNTALLAMRTLAMRLHLSEPDQALVFMKPPSPLVSLYESVTKAEKSLRLTSGTYLLVPKMYVDQLAGKLGDYKIVDGYLVPKDLDNLLTYRTFPSVLPGMTYMSVNVTVERTHLAGGCAKG